MEAALPIFLNGIFGVYVGLAVLYAAIKVSHLLLGREPDKKEQ